MSSTSSVTQKPGAQTQRIPTILGQAYKVFPTFQGEIVYCKILCPFLEIRSEPSWSAEIIDKKGEDSVIVIRNDNEAPDPELGWMQLTLSGDGFVPASARDTDLEPLPYASPEVLDTIRYLWGMSMNQAENLILSRIRKVTKHPSAARRGQVVQIGYLEGDDEEKEFRKDAYRRAVASNIRSSTAVIQDLSTRYVTPLRPFRKGELIEACRIFPLKDKPGESLISTAVELDDGIFGMPLGYAAFYVQAAGDLQANAEAFYAKWAVGGGYVLLIKALCTVFPGQVIVLSGKPKRMNSPWLLEGPPKTKGLFGQLERALGPESGGLVHWGASKLHGAGVFATQARPKGSVLELCPTLQLDKQSECAAQDYAMTFDAFGTIEPEACCLNLGLGSLYNHSDHSNADYWYDRSMGTLAIIAKDDILAGEEIFINYGEGYWKARSEEKKK